MEVKTVHEMRERLANEQDPIWIKALQSALKMEPTAKNVWNKLEHFRGLLQKSADDPDGAAMVATTPDQVAAQVAPWAWIFGDAELSLATGGEPVATVLDRLTKVMTRTSA